ncbi:YczI family protein [Metabacillus bambusae]|uniref:YczI family protein n=1 Tax=Metabacillus bambusae TaxID=2795218 RepID=A0ABS3MYZ6_9BACI|nr:YczI family protein [Metabacillus bambusae]MBO1511247.1 YczI family protein [Metabacillus bambusae]
MLKILRYIFSIVAMLFAVYGLIKSNFELQPYMMFFLGLMVLVMGLEEFKKERKAYGWLFVIVCLFSLYVSIQGFFLN